MSDVSQNSKTSPKSVPSTPASYREDSPQQVHSDARSDEFAPSPSSPPVDMCTPTYSIITSEEILCHEPQSLAGLSGNEDVNVDTYFSRISPFRPIADDLDGVDVALRQLPRHITDQWHRRYSYNVLPASRQHIQVSHIAPTSPQLVNKERDFQLNKDNEAFLTIPKNEIEHYYFPTYNPRRQGLQ